MPRGALPRGAAPPAVSPCPHRPREERVVGDIRRRTTLWEDDGSRRRSDAPPRRRSKHGTSRYAESITCNPSSTARAVQTSGRINRTCRRPVQTPYFTTSSAVFGRLGPRGLSSKVSWEMFLFEGRLEPRLEPKLLHRSNRHKPSLTVRSPWSTRLPRVISQLSPPHPTCLRSTAAPSQRRRLRTPNFSPFLGLTPRRARPQGPTPAKRPQRPGTPHEQLHAAKLPPLPLREKALGCFNASR